MHVVRHVVRLLLLSAALACFGTCSANSANPFESGPRWTCWYAPGQLSVQCLLTQVPTQGLEQRAMEVASRIDGRLPTLVKMIWGSPEQLAGTHISIPLMNVPFEMEFVALLAKSVMCGARRDCSVNFDPNADGLAPVRAAALESGSSEAEVMAEVASQGLVLARAEAPSVMLPPKKRPRGAMNI